jgi:antitoxin MazE
MEGRMQVQVGRWGNSLGLRIPKDIALRTGLREGARVDVETDGDRIIISPARQRYVLADLLKGMTPEAMREAFDWGPDKGREIVE